MYGMSLSTIFRAQDSLDSCRIYNFTWILRFLRIHVKFQVPLNFFLQILLQRRKTVNLFWRNSKNYVKRSFLNFYRFSVLFGMVQKDAIVHLTSIILAEIRKKKKVFMHTLMNSYKCTSGHDIFVINP